MSDSCSAWSKTLVYFPGSKLYQRSRYRRRSCSKIHVLWSLSRNQLSGFFSLSFNPFSMGFFLIERPIEVLLSRKEWAIFDIWGWSYSTPKFEKSDFSEITFFKSIFGDTIFNVVELAIPLRFWFRYKRVMVVWKSKYLIFDPKLLY